VNNCQFTLATIKGEFVWHSYPEMGKAFVVIDGEMSIEFQAGTVDVKSGELYVVPNGVEHRR
jgi:mannose-6-phosphate isomerase-like protein (cupin superfamily)